jgi:DNA sulfur modification protein DndB
MTVKEKILTGIELETERRIRNQQHIYEKIEPVLFDSRREDGWIFDKKLKNRIKIKKLKSYDVLFENEVWLLFEHLGFKFLNKDRYFNMPYSSDEKLTQQIDVFAADDETALFIECKSTTAPHKKTNFKESIEAIGGKRQGIMNELRKLFPDKKLKVKFIFATKNYIVSAQDKQRMSEFEIVHFDENIIAYYYDLFKHLGISAKYQLLGYLFAGQKIPELNNVVPAIEGKMGGHKYYSFSIEPERLLKLGYILHRNNANKDEMPAYQRLIKKPRLQSINNFIENGGFFPNSIIININTGKKSLKFDTSELQEKNSLSRIGLLHLPQLYKSVYIIDGQHRLYGYAESEYKSKHTIPVVAFLNLEKSEQIKLFMEINENQKAVSKSLRNTLNADLLWYSEDLSEQREALCLFIAQKMGEDTDSPLFNRVVIGENQKDPRCCITIEIIKNAILNGGFLTTFRKNVIQKDGTLDKGDNDATEKILFLLISESLSHIKQNLLEKWEKGESDNNFICINVAIYGYIRVTGDIIQHLIDKKNLNPKNTNIEEMFAEIKYYLDPAIHYLKSLSVEKGLELKGRYGSGGQIHFWRTMQKAISDERNEFNPEKLADYWRDNAKTYNEESYKMIRDIETHIKSDFRVKLRSKYGKEWFRTGVPKKVYNDANSLASDKNYSRGEGQDEIDPWDCLHLIDYKEIAVYGSNWSDLFEKDYTRPGEEKSGNKDKKTDWINKLNAIRNQNFHTYSVTEEEYKFLKNIFGWLCKK